MTRIQRISVVLARFLHRRAGLVLLVTALLVVVATMLASRLRIDQELRRLLPDHFQSVQRLERLSTRLGQQSDLFVTIRSPSREANIAFGERLAERLAERNDVRFVQFRRDLAFFEERALLYASLADVVDLRRRVIHRIREEVRKKAFGEFDSAEDEEADAKAPEASASASALGFDIDEMRKSYGVSETTSEFMEADEGRLMVVKIRPTRPSTDLAFAQQLSAEVLASAESLEPAKFHPELTFGLDGAYVQHTGRVRSLQTEVLGGSLSAAAALLLTLAIYFRSFRGVLLVFVPLLGSVVGALAYAWLRFDVLNLVSAFIFAVLLGLGVDHGIHVMSRFRQERARGLDSEAALARTFETTGWTTVAGSISTAAAFASLMVADFRGFSQFGEVAAVGVALSVVAAIVVMPALILLLDRVRPWRISPLRTFEGARAEFSRTTKIVAMVACLGGLGFAAWGATGIGDLAFEHDLRQLGPRSESTEPTSATYRDAVGRGQTVDPIVVLAEAPEQVDEIQAQLLALKAMTPVEVATFDPRAWPSRPLPPAPAAPELDEDEALDEDEEDFGDEDLDDPKFVAIEGLASREALMSAKTAELLGRYGNERLQVMRDRLGASWSLAAFVPRHQEEKLEVIRDVRRRIQDKYGLLAAQTRAEIDQWMHYLDVDAPVRRDDLPAWVRAQFETASGAPGGFLILGTNGSKADVHNARRIYGAYATLETAAGPVDTAAEFFVIPEIFDTIERDGPVVLMLSIGVMLCAAWLLLRRVGAMFAVAVTIGLALLWLVGIMLALDWKLNFFNIIVVPLLLGMGEDDALHLAERDHDMPGQMRRVLSEAGGPIFMTTITTVWGFSGILFANHRGLESMAWTAVCGMTLALVASVLVLPVLLEVGRALRRRAR